MDTPKRKPCWVTRQLKKESRRGNADDSSQQTSTAEGTYLLSLAATIYNPPGGMTTTWDFIDSGGRTCFVISLQIRVCAFGTSLLKLTFSMMIIIIIITFFIIIIIIIFLLLIVHHCFSCVFKVQTSSSTVQMGLLQQIIGWRSEAEVFCPCGNATSNSNTLRVMLQKCTWKGFCVSLLHKSTHVLSDQARLLMFPRVQLS